MLSADEAGKLLTYIAAWDNRKVTPEVARVWADGMPEWLTLDLGIKAARQFFSEAAAPADSYYLSPKVLIHYAARIRREERAKRQAKLDVLTALTAVEIAERQEALGAPARERRPRFNGIQQLNAMTQNFGKAES